MSARSLRPKISCTPVWGPGPVAYWVSGCPFGCMIVNDSFTGLPAGTGPEGVNPEMWLTPAALPGTTPIRSPGWRRSRPATTPAPAMSGGGSGLLREEVEAVRRDQPAQLDHDLGA